MWYSSGEQAVSQSDIQLVRQPRRLNAMRLTELPEHQIARAQRSVVM